MERRVRGLARERVWAWYLGSMFLSQAPRAHRDPVFLAAKVARLREPHVAPLNDLADRIGVETGMAVPAFDPDSAGINARSLFLFEAPGARSTAAAGPRAAAKGSGIISPDNNDGTAENMWRLHEAAGLARTSTLAWNIVPWYVGTDTKIRPVERDDLQAAAPYLAALIALLPDLRVVVTFGDKPRQGWFRYLLHDDAPLLPTLAVPHPSPLSLNPHPENRDLILRALRRVAEVAR